jgi:hypothetical protein
MLLQSSHRKSSRATAESQGNMLLPANRELLMWQVKLHGERSILERLAHLLPTGELVVSQYGDEFFLSSEILEDATGTRDIDAIGKELAKILSGISAVQIEAREEVTSGHLVRADADGGRHIYVFPGTGHFYMSTLNVDAKGTIYRTDGTVEKSSEFARNAVRRAVESALHSDARAKAYRLRGDTELLWSDLYRILEVIETEVPQSKMIEQSWTTKNELERFTRSANSVAVAGDHARHGKERFSAPAKPMTISEATDFIDRLLRLWET